MTFKPNRPMPRDKAQLAIELYKDVAVASGERAFRVFSEPRTESRKIKLWGLTSANYKLLVQLYTDYEIPFYTADFRSIAFNVPRNVTMSGKVVA